VKNWCSGLEKRENETTGRICSSEKTIITDGSKGSLEPHNGNLDRKNAQEKIRIIWKADNNIGRTTAF
tara:strand:- start:664 stop:867 length:204 start_codon:yes stop_codon:yes gene_type:complete